MIDSRARVLCVEYAGGIFWEKILNKKVEKVVKVERL